MNKNLKEMEPIVGQTNQPFSMNPDLSHIVVSSPDNQIPGKYEKSYICTSKVNVCVVAKENDSCSYIVGYIDKDILFKKDEEKKVELLIRAINNRTRERNYFRLYCQLLEKEITEEEFDAEIEEHEDDYVTSADQDASYEDFQFALETSSEIMDVKDASDMIDLFSFNDCSIQKYINNG